MAARMSPRAVWLALHEPRQVTAWFVVGYLLLAYGGLGVVLVDHGLLPVGVWSARMVSGWAFLLGGLIAAPMAGWGIWWVERLGIGVLALGFLARVLAVLKMGDTYDDEGHVVFALTAWLALAAILFARFLWVRISPYRLGAGPLPPALEATLARARLESDERKSTA